MSDFGMFEADEATQDQPRLAARTAARKLEAAIDTVRNEFGRFLMGATGIDEFEDRWHLSKADIRKAVEPFVFPNTGTMRRVQNAMKADWKLAHPYKLAEDRDAPIQNLEETFHPSSGNLIPDGDFEGYKDSVDQNGPEKVEAHDFTPGGDSGSDRHAHRRYADEGSGTPGDPIHVPTGSSISLSQTPGGGKSYIVDPPAMMATVPGSRPSPHGSSDPQAFQPSQNLGVPLMATNPAAKTSGIDREAAALIADIYTDFARSNGMRVASLDTLDHYASTGIAEADYRLLESMIIRAAEEAEESEEEPEEDGEDDHEEPDADNKGGPSDGDEDNEDDDESDEGDSDDDEDYDFGGGEEGGEAAGGDAGGEQFTVPEQAPQLPPQMMQEIPQDDAGGTAPVPPEVIDSLLGLPEGTIEQLLLEEAQNGQGGDAPQAGGDDFFGGGGGDNTEPPRVARRRQAGQVVDGVDWDDAFRNTVQEWPNWAPSQRKEFMEQALAAGVKRPQYHQDADYRIKNYDENNSSMPKKPLPQASRLFWAAPDESEGELTERQKREQKDSLDTQHQRWLKEKAARRFWAADDDSKSSDGDSSGGDGGGQQDPAAGGMDPSMMGQMGGGMMPPPGSASVAPPQPAMPLENQPAEDALLDTANQAIMQMIDRETAEYQQIIGPLSQALQAVQFAQQVEQSEHPMDVTPPQGSVNVDPSQAPGGAGNPMQQQASCRIARPEVTRHEDGSSTWPCEKCGSTVYRYRGQSDTECDRCNAQYNAFGQRLRDDWRNNRSNYDDEYGDMEGYEDSFRDASRRRQAKVRRIVRNAAKLIANTYGVSERMLVEAMGRRQYEHVAEAFHILPPQARQTREVRAAWDHIGNMFAADNSMFNKDVWMRSLDNPGSRLPFDRPRLAGETWKNTPTMDRFEFPRAGETPEISDNMTINDLPQGKFKGVPKPKKNSRRQVADLGSKVQRWLQRQTETGLNMGGDAMADRYLNEHSHPTSQRGIDEVHEALGATPHTVPTEPPNPSVRIPKATNPVTKRGTRQVPLETLYLRHRVNGRHGVGYSLFPGPNGWDDHDALGVQVKWDEDPLTWGPKDNPDTEDAKHRTDKWPYNQVGYTHYDRQIYPITDFDIVGTLPGNLDPDKHQDVFDPREFGASRTAKFVDDEYGGYHTRDDDDPEHVFTNPRNGEKYMIQHEDGTLFKPGHPLTGIHGDQYHLKGISKYPEGPSGGKIHVDDGDGSREFYPSVFDAEIVPYTGGWNPDDDQDPFDPRLIGAGRTATWGEWEPTKEASFFTRRVPGWRWDDYLNGYISKEGKAFTCSCGQKVAAPSYKTCDCGKIWNVYAIGDQHHLGSDTADMFIAREIPVRDNVIMANKKMAGAPERLGDKVRKHLADWTKYDGEDPVAKTYGKPKPPSTKVSQPPKDWAKRLPAGDPSKKGGTWTQPPIAPKTTPKQ